MLAKRIEWANSASPPLFFLFLMSRLPFLALLSLFLPCDYSRAQEPVGFVEKFALAADRAEALKELIPGTSEYYFYHALYAQQQELRAEYERLLKEWADREPQSALRDELGNRQLLLDFNADPKRVLATLAT